MRRNSGFTILVERRTFEMKKTVENDTQRLREKWINKLDNLFEMASSIAMPNEKAEDKTKSVSPKERQLWAHVAAHVGLVMGNLAKGLDEQQFNEDFAKLESLIGEVKKYQTQLGRAGNIQNQPVLPPPDNSSESATINPQ